jgi:hypothetical protein
VNGRQPGEEWLLSRADTNNLTLWAVTLAQVYLLAPVEQEPEIERLFLEACELAGVEPEDMMRAVRLAEGEAS